MRTFIYPLLIVFFSFSISYSDVLNNKDGLNLIKDIMPFNDDGTINVVIEISAGSNEK